MRIVCAAAMIALFAGPAFAQTVDGHVQRYGEADHVKNPVEIEADKEAQRAYKRSLGNIPEHAPVDPWGGARSSDTSKPATKADAKTSSAKPKVKPAATPN